MNGKQALEKIKNIEFKHTEFEMADFTYSYEVYDGTIEENYPDEIEAIEQDLEEYENFKLKMEYRPIFIQGVVSDDYNKLKAFEIIKDKIVSVPILKDSKDFIYYNWYVYDKNRALTQEEYNLLKEVLS